MATQSLREALLALPGVAEADVDESSGAPSGVRVTLAPDADGRVVGAAVQRVLATHGLRSRITAGNEPGAAPSGNGAPAGEADFVPPPPPTTPPPDPGAIVAEEASAAPESVDAALVPDETAEAPGPPSNDFELASVAVSETTDAVTVTATATDGRTHTLEGAPTEDGLFGAVIGAVAALAAGAPSTVVSVDAQRTAGSEVITVVLEGPDGRRTAGAAVVVADRAFAAARATVAAIRSR
jgi:hypothetical protein